MSYFLIPEPILVNHEYTISDDEARHVSSSRRARINDEIIVQGSNEVRCRALITEINPKYVRLRTVSTVATPAEPTTQIALLQALIAEQALDIILQKSTELGASKIILFPAEYSPRSYSTDKKLVRWQRICLEAAKQSDRLRTPELHVLKDVEEALEYAEGLDMCFALNPLSSTNMGEVSLEKLGHIGVLIGPEGGWSDRELKLFQRNDEIQEIRFGPRILRAETAALAALTVVQYQFGDMK